MNNLEKNNLPNLTKFQKMEVDMDTKSEALKMPKSNESMNNSAQGFNHIKKLETLKKITKEQPLVGLNCIPTGNPPDRD